MIYLKDCSFRRLYAFMRFIPFKLGDYDFLFYKNSIFCALKYLLNKTGDDALKIEFRLQFFVC